MAIKILAAGDLHLGKRSSGIPDNEPAGSAIYTWNRIVDWCLNNHVDVLALLGDIVDSENRIYQTIKPLFDGFTRLQEKEIQVIMVSGNHDYDVPAQIDRAVGLDNVTVIGRNGKWEMKPFKKGNLFVQFVGWSFPGDSVTLNPLLGLNDLSFDSNLPYIGLLHCDVNAINSRYAPVPLSGLISTPIDAWLLGHIHKPTELHPAIPMIRYTGSPHAFSAKEPGEHGPLLVTVNGKNDITAQTIPIAPIRYEKIIVDINPGMQKSDVQNSIMSQLIAGVNEMNNASKHLKRVVFDLELIGEHENVAMVDGWEKKDSKSEQDFSGSVQFSIRKVSNNVVPAITNLEEYVSKNTPVGLLAGTILAIQEKKTTPMLERLMEKWMANYQKMQSSRTYYLLGNTTTDKDQIIDLAKKSILKECNRMISELINQHTE